MKVLLDKSNYFTGTYASTGGMIGGIEVNSLPSDLSDNKSNAWKYEPHEEYIPNPDYIEPTDGETIDDIPKTIKITREWVFDEDKYNQILKEIQIEEENKSKILTNEQLTKDLNDLTEVVLLESDIDTTENIEL